MHNTSFLWFLKFYNVHILYSLIKIKIKISTHKRNRNLFLGFILCFYCNHVGLNIFFNVGVIVTIYTTQSCHLSSPSFSYITQKHCPSLLKTPQCFLFSIVWCLNYSGYYTSPFIIWSCSTYIIQVCFLLLPRSVLHSSWSGLITACATLCSFFDSAPSVYCSCNCLLHSPFVPKSYSSSGGFSISSTIELCLTLGWTLKSTSF